eukprot:jgi/Undpi1/8282/HiC_scaffold_25.g10751.m1
MSADVSMYNSVGGSVGVSVMVQMMVEAAFSSNASTLKVKLAQVLVGSAATIPGSVILPYLFETAVAPPRSITSKSKRLMFTSYGKLSRKKEAEGESALERGNVALDGPAPAASLVARTPVDGSSTRLTNKDNVFLTFLEMIHSALHSKAVYRWERNVGVDLSRARGLVFASLIQILLDMVCLGLSAAVGLDTLLRRALLALSGLNILLTMLMIDVVLAARATMFSLVNFKVVFALAFARICVTLMQAVVAFHDTKTGESSDERLMESFIVAVAVVNIVTCFSVRMLDSKLHTTVLVHT